MQFNSIYIAKIRYPMQSLFRNYKVVLYLDRGKVHQDENMMKTVLTIRSLSCIVKEIINVQ